MDIQMFDPIDDLVKDFTYKTAVVWKPKQNFVKDINIIIEELNNYSSFIHIDIYEVLVSCGHNLTWDQEYNISYEDLNWFKNEGKNYIISLLGSKINSLYEYNAINNIFVKLIELFELQLEIN